MLNHLVLTSLACTELISTFHGSNHFIIWLNKKRLNFLWKPLMQIVYFNSKHLRCLSIQWNEQITSLQVYHFKSAVQVLEQSCEHLSCCRMSDLAAVAAIYRCRCYIRTRHPCLSNHCLHSFLPSDSIASGSPVFQINYHELEQVFRVQQAQLCSCYVKHLNTYQL